MPTLDEIMGAKTSFAADAATGVQVLSDMGEVVFDKYNRVVLPLDGYVFWVKDADPETSITVSGSFHYNTDTRQEEAANYSASMCVFTALSEVEDLRAIAPGVAYIATLGLMTFAFSSRGYFYKKADLFHYRGFATFSDVLTQVVPSGTDLHVDEVIVNNSLPLWLLFNTYMMSYGFQTSGVTAYPSFLVPDNLEPPYAAIHVVPESTLAIGGAPRLSYAPGNNEDLVSSQLVQERVRVTLYGTRNFSATAYLNFVNQFTLDTKDVLGIMNQPTVQDLKRTQSELSVIAQKKVIEFQVNYYQSSVYDIARQLIEHAGVTFNLG